MIGCFFFFFTFVDVFGVQRENFSGKRTKHSWCLTTDVWRDAIISFSTDIKCNFPNVYTIRTDERTCFNAFIIIYFDSIWKTDEIHLNEFCQQFWHLWFVYFIEQYVDFQRLKIKFCWKWSQRWWRLRILIRNITPSCTHQLINCILIPGSRNTDHGNDWFMNHSTILLLLFFSRVPLSAFGILANRTLYIHIVTTHRIVLKSIFQLDKNVLTIIYSNVLNSGTNFRWRKMCQTE